MSLRATISSAADDRSTRLAGILLMLTAVAMFAFGDALGKYIVATYTVGQLMLLRSCAAFVLMGPSIWHHRGEFRRMNRPWLQLLRVVLSTIEIAAFFLATVYLPLADVVTYYQATPIFVTALSGLVLGEQIGWRRWSAILVGFGGVLIALRPSAQTITWPAVIALAGSLAFSCSLLTTRLLRTTPDIVLASVQFAGGLAFGLVIAPAGWVTPTWNSLVLFFAAGAISACALFCVNRSLKLAPASTVVPYQYTMIVWAVAFGYIVFGDIPSLSTAIGAAVVIAAGLYIFFRERQLGRAETVVSPPA
jgi:drug/metabolite transporter (DMT)-like permease